MVFTGRKISQDGSPDVTYIVEVVDARICRDGEELETCSSIKAGNSAAEYTLEPADGQKLSTAMAEGFTAALAEGNMVNLDDFGLVIGNIEYGERTVEGVKKSEKSKKRSLWETVQAIITGCLINDSIVAASQLLDYEGKFKVPAEEEAAVLDKCVKALQEVIDEYCDKEDVTLELLKEIERTAFGRYYKGTGLSYLVILKAASFLVEQEETLD